jgi:hypothetical protein
MHHGMIRMKITDPHTEGLTEFGLKITKDKFMLFDVFLLLGDSPASEFYVPTFRITLAI